MRGGVAASDRGKGERIYCLTVFDICDHGGIILGWIKGMCL
jgi:hypothetical protein